MIMRKYKSLGFVCVLIGLATVAVGSNPPTRLQGCWVVKKVLPTTNIAALTQKEVDRILGTRLVYSNSCVQSRRFILKSPKFTTRVLTDREFFEEFYNIPLKQLGITASEVTIVNVAGSEDQGAAFVGDTVFLGSKNPVIEFDGVFFQLAKAKQQNDKCTCVK